MSRQTVEMNYYNEFDISSFKSKINKQSTRAYGTILSNRKPLLFCFTEAGKFDEFTILCNDKFFKESSIAFSMNIDLDDERVNLYKSLLELHFDSFVSTDLIHEDVTFDSILNHTLVNGKGIKMFDGSEDYGINIIANANADSSHLNGSRDWTLTTVILVDKNNSETILSKEQSIEYIKKLVPTKQEDGKYSISRIRAQLYVSIETSLALKDSKPIIPSYTKEGPGYLTKQQYSPSLKIRVIKVLVQDEDESDEL